MFDCKRKRSKEQNKLNGMVQNIVQDIDNIIDMKYTIFKGV